MCVWKRIEVTPVVVLALICALGITVTTGHAEERHVPDPYLTIQAAIDDCDDYDVVIVDNGVYTELGFYNLDFLGRTITVRSDSDNPEACILQCNEENGTEDRRGFYFHSGETAECVVRGFTIRWGYRDSGGAIYCESASSPTIINCILDGNTAHPYQGGAIYCTGSSSPIIAIAYQSAAKVGDG